MSTPAEIREAQRAARKARILENKNDRMSKVRGEYNQHRAHDSDDDEDSRFQHSLFFLLAEFAQIISSLYLTFYSQ